MGEHATHELLTSEEMAEADRRAVALGVLPLTLMENAGRAVADEAEKLVRPGARIAVLCGPGNNGGDGFVAARCLKERGYDVRVSCLVPLEQLKGDAAVMARRCPVKPRPAAIDAIQATDLVIDALFGAGLSRPLAGEAAQLVAAINSAAKAVLCVDVPSGLDGTTGAVGNGAVKATRTITFFRRKPGHLLVPGRLQCGEVVVASIGIPDDVFYRPLSTSVLGTEQGEGWGEGQKEAPAQAAGPYPGSHPMQAQTIGGGEGPALTHENHPALWLSRYPWPALDGHKYARGHALVVSGPAFQSGAARLAARGALRMGAGLVTVASPPSALPENAAHLTAIMLRPCADARDLELILADTRKNAVLIGPGAGVGEVTRDQVLAVLGSPARVVLDADALTCFASSNDEASRSGVTGFGFTASAQKRASGRDDLLAAIRARVGSDGIPLVNSTVLTPHEGEFARLFPDLAKLPSKLERARGAARVSGAIVVLKGPDTIIAHPGRRAAINTNAPPWLATAGSGDVLAGFICGLLAQGLPAFDAACAAVWLHGECASAFGAGLIAEDLPERLPDILDNLHQAAGRPHWDPSKRNGGIG